MHDDHDHQHEDHSLDEAKAAPPEELKGQHLYFIVRGETSEVAYAAAKERGVRVLDVRRLRESIDPETEEVEMDDPKDKTKKIKVPVVKAKQTPVYQGIDTDSDQDDQRRARHGALPAFIDSEHNFIVKTSAPRAVTKL